MTSTEVRKLRDTVYGKPISDKEWETCKANWMTPDNVRWLIEKAQRPLLNL